SWLLLVAGTGARSLAPNGDRVEQARGSAGQRAEGVWQGGDEGRHRVQGAGQPREGCADLAAAAAMDEVGSEQGERPGGLERLDVQGAAALAQQDDRGERRRRGLSEPRIGDEVRARAALVLPADPDAARAGEGGRASAVQRYRDPVLAEDAASLLAE